MPQEFKDLYEICMNKDFKTRPTISDIFGLEFIQKWAKDLNIKNQQLLKYSR